MRRTLTALVLFSATLFMLQSLPQKESVPVQRSDVDSRTMVQWIETSVADFQAGQPDCMVVETTGDGGLALASEEGHYCPLGIFVSEVHDMGVVFNVLGSSWAAERRQPRRWRRSVAWVSHGPSWWCGRGHAPAR